jgi:hypothetical protein
MKVRFREEFYQLVVTDHAKERMLSRGITEEALGDILKTGSVKLRDKPNHFWVYKMLRDRKDNFICLSVSLEAPFLIVITTLVNWRPR